MRSNHALYFQDFSPIIRLLLTNQSFIDGTTCLFASILLLQPENWIPGVKVLDEIICQLWSSQFMFWYSLLMSSEYISVLLGASFIIEISLLSVRKVSNYGRFFFFIRAAQNDSYNLISYPKYISNTDKKSPYNFSPQTF